MYASRVRPVMFLGAGSSRCFTAVDMAAASCAASACRYLHGDTRPLTHPDAVTRDTGMNIRMWRVAMPYLATLVNNGFSLFGEGAEAPLVS